MAKAKIDIEMEEELVVDTDFEQPREVQIEHSEEPSLPVARKRKVVDDTEFVSCLRNEKVVVRFTPKESGMIQNPKHVLYGGMAEGASRTFTVPILESSKTFVNVLTTDEKNFLEQIMGLEPNALSIYLKQNNFWENFTVRLIKGDNILDLNDPADYIKYKVLLANKDYIAPSIKDMQDYPKGTYQYVIVSENVENKENDIKVSSTVESYMEFGKIDNDFEILRLIVETITGRPISTDTKISFLKKQISDTIQSNPKLFLDIVKDKYLTTKVLIRKAIEKGLISKRGTHLHLRSDGSPLCDNNQEPTLNVAAKYLNLPKNQELKTMLEVRIQE